MVHWLCHCRTYIGYSYFCRRKWNRSICGDYQSFGHLTRKEIHSMNPDYKDYNKFPSIKRHPWEKRITRSIIVTPLRTAVCFVDYYSCKSIDFVHLFQNLRLEYIEQQNPTASSKVLLDVKQILGMINCEVFRSL